MQLFHQIITTIVFAAHALLGCGVHHACQHKIATAAPAGEHHAMHGCAPHHHDHDASQSPADEGTSPTSACEHTVCSFVKADSVRIDLCDDHVAWMDGLAAADFAASVRSRPVAVPLCMADISSTHLYVWHCALLI